MKITLTGSLGNINKYLAINLIDAGHEVTVISSNAHKSEAITTLGATAAIGSIDDVAFLTEVFKTADVVYTMAPPNFAAKDYRLYISTIGKNYAEAIKTSGIKRVVNLSSIGAHLSGGNGPIAGLYDIEQLFNTLDGVSITHLRPACFYINFFGNIEMIKHAGILGANYGADVQHVLVHPYDIALVAAEEIQKSSEGKTIRYIASDEPKAKEIANAIGREIGKPDLPWIEFSDAQGYEGLIQAGLPEEIAKNFIEMGVAIRTGELFEDYFLQQVELGTTKLTDFAKEFSLAYHSAD